MATSQALKYLAIVLLMLCVISCQREDDTDLSNDTELIDRGFKIERIDFNALKQNENVLSALEPFTNKNTSGNELSRIIHDSVNGFYIDTEKVIYIEKEGYHSYTFSMVPYEDNEKIENLLLSLQADQSYKAFILSYNLTDEEIETHKEGGIVDFTEKMDVKSLAEFDFENMSSNEAARECLDFAWIQSPRDWGFDLVITVVDCPDESNNEDDPEEIDAGDSSTGGATGGDSQSGPNTGNPNSGSTGEQTEGDPGSDDGSSSGGSTNGSNSNENNGNSPDDNEDCILDVDGNCIDDTSSLILIDDGDDRSVDEKNCDELQKLFSIPNYPITPPLKSPKQAIAHLKTLLDQNGERGYSLNHLTSNLNAVASWISNPNNNSIRYPYRQNTYGGCHSHQNDGKGDPFFSGQDLLDLLQFKNTYNNGTLVDPSLFVHVLVSNAGSITNENPVVHAIKIENPVLLQNLQIIVDDHGDADNDGIDLVLDFSKKIKQKYVEFEDPDTGQPNSDISLYQKALLRFLNDFDGNGSKTGISLYKANDDLTNWSKLTLSENNNINSDPCSN